MIERPISIICGTTSCRCWMVSEMPVFKSPRPLSELPLKISVRPSMTVVSAGMNPEISPRLRPSMDVVMSCRLSWYAAAALTASSDMTPPSSWTLWRIFSVSSAEVLSRAPSSVPPLPRSFDARYVRSVSLSTFCRAVMVAPNSSSCDIFAISSCDMPSCLKASFPVSAAVASVFMPVFIVSMDAPECCRIASHSW